MSRALGRTRQGLILTQACDGKGPIASLRAIGRFDPVLPGSGGDFGHAAKISAAQILKALAPFLRFPKATRQFFFSFLTPMAKVSDDSDIAAVVLESGESAIRLFLRCFRPSFSLREFRDLAGLGPLSHGGNLSIAFFVSGRVFSPLGRGRRLLLVVFDFFRPAGRGWS